MPYPTAPTFSISGELVPRDRQTGTPLPDYAGLTVVYFVTKRDLEPWLSRTWKEEGTRCWEAIPRDDWPEERR